MSRYPLTIIEQAAVPRQSSVTVALQRPGESKLIPLGRSVLAAAAIAALPSIQIAGGTLLPGGAIPPDVRVSVAMSRPPAPASEVPVVVATVLGKVYISNGANTGLVYTLSQDNVRGADISGMRRPTEMTGSPDGLRVLANEEFNSGWHISAINTADDSAAGQATFSFRPQYARFSPDSSVAYVTSINNDSACVVEVLAMSDLSVAAGFTFPNFDQPIVIAVHRDGTKLYCGNNRVGGGTKITVLSLPDFTEGVTVDLPDFADGINQMLMNNAGTKLYVTGNEGLVVYDTATDTVGPLINVGTTPWGMCISADDSKLYVACGYDGDGSADSTLAVVDAATDTLITNVPIFPTGASFSFPWECAITPDGTKVFLTVFEDFGAVAVVNTADLSVVYDNQSTGFTWTPNGIAIVPVQ